MNGEEMAAVIVIVVGVVFGAWLGFCLGTLS